jgi:ADP-ribosyl-[dinitrogen reductase] hydrolase
MLYHMAIGDAYGAGFEFVKHEAQEASGQVNNTQTYYAHPSLNIGGGRYTDDTQMAIAITEFLLYDYMLMPSVTKLTFAHRFVDAFKRDPRLGYGSRFHSFLQESTTGHDLLAHLQPNSTRSGAAMRVSPIGLLPDIDEVIRLSDLQASVTHDSPEGLMSSRAIALMVHFLSHVSGDPADLGLWLEEKVPGYAWNDDWTDWVSVQGMPCAHAAIAAVQRGTSQRAVLERCIAYGGDVDTVAAMAMFSASLCHRADLPPELHAGLEQGPHGADFLHKWDRSLIELFLGQMEPIIPYHLRPSLVDKTT